MEETVRAFNHVIEQKGWAMYWGTSEWSADEIAEACGIAKQLGLIAPVVEQPMYNLITRQKVEREFQRLYARFGIGLTTFSPLNFGLLSGKYNNSPDAPPAGSRFAEGNDKFVNSMRDSYGNDSWKGMIEKATKLAVCTTRPQQTSKLILDSLSQRGWALPNLSYRWHGVSRTRMFLLSSQEHRGPSKL